MAKVKVKLEFSEADFQLMNDSFSKAGISWDKFASSAVLSVFDAAITEFKCKEAEREQLERDSSEGR